MVLLRSRSAFLPSSPPALADLQPMKRSGTLSRVVSTRSGFSWCAHARLLVEPWSASACRHGPSLAPEHVFQIAFWRGPPPTPSDRGGAAHRPLALPSRRGRCFFLQLGRRYSWVGHKVT